MAITALPTPPQRNDPDNFPTRGDAFMAALPTFATEANALQTDVNAKQVLANTSATNAATSEANALTSANNAATSAATALNAPGTSATSTTSLTIALGTQSLTIQTGKSISPGQPYVVAYTTTPTIQMAGTVTSYNPGTGALVLNITTISGSGTYALWTVSLGIIVNPAPSSLNRVTRTSNTALTTAEQGKLIDVTSGTFTQTTNSAASLGLNWWCYLTNSGTGVVTYGSYLLTQGSTILLQSDGTNITTVLQRLGEQVLMVRDERTSSTNGDSFTGGSWNARTLNTVVRNTLPGASLAGNAITLPAGTYEVTGSFMAYNTSIGKTRLQGAGLGIFMYSDNCVAGASANGQALISGIVTIGAGAASITASTYSQLNQSNGGGININGGPEIYSYLTFRKIA